MMTSLIINTNPENLDIDLIYQFLSTEAYWCKGIPRHLVEKAIANSLCFGAYLDGKQVAFARMITDKATYAYLADVFVLTQHRGKAISKALMAYILAYPDLQGLRRIALMTADAHGLYQQYGFSLSKNFDRYMEINVPACYQNRES